MHDITWTPEQVRGVRSNPLYVGIYPFPALVSDREWVRSAVEAIHDHGAEQFLVNMLHVLRSTLQCVSDAENANRSDALITGVQILQRVYQMTPSEAAVSSLLEQGFSSAHDIVTNDDQHHDELRVRAFLQEASARLREALTLTAASKRSEYQQLVEALESHLSTPPLSDVTEREGRQDVSFLGNDTGGPQAG
ncbi:MAG: hypothetical protein NTW97_05555 [Candidatus Krumholzibacteria bacterium]|nr:hypothetical protein [Candidatus Krumholzibacteria bacterium]